MGFFHNQKHSWLSRAGGLLALLLLGAGLIARAEPVSVPHSFTSGSTISSSQVNANFAALKDGIDHNKPVIACANNTGTDTALSGGYVNIASISITVPGPGTILVTANGTISDNHTLNNGDGARLNVSNVSASGSQFQAEWLNSPAWLGGLYRVPFFIQGGYPVPQAGTFTYYLTGLRQFNTEPISISFATICAVFAPN